MPEQRHGKSSRQSSSNASAHAATFRTRSRSDSSEGCLPALQRLLKDPYGDVQADALTLIALILGNKSEPILIECLQDKSFRHKYAAIHYISRLGTIASVPAVAEWVKTAVTRRRSWENRETDLVVAVEFLNHYIDKSDEVEPAFAQVVTHFDNLAQQEGDRIRATRWIGFRVNDRAKLPAHPPGSKAHFQTPTGCRTLRRSDAE